MSAKIRNRLDSGTLIQSLTVKRMAMFVHLTIEAGISGIRRNGIARLRKFTLRQFRGTSTLRTGG